MRGLLFFTIFEGGDAGVEVSIHELLAAAREAVKSESDWDMVRMTHG